MGYNISTTHDQANLAQEDLKLVYPALRTPTDSDKLSGDTGNAEDKFLYGYKKVNLDLSPFLTCALNSAKRHESKSNLDLKISRMSRAEQNPPGIT